MSSVLRWSWGSKRSHSDLSLDLDIPFDQCGELFGPDSDDSSEDDESNTGDDIGDSAHSDSTINNNRFKSVHSEIDDRHWG